MLWLCPRSGDPHSPQAEAALWNSESPNLLGSEGASKRNRDVTLKVLRVPASPSPVGGPPTSWSVGYRVAERQGPPLAADELRPF